MGSDKNKHFLAKKVLQTYICLKRHLRELEMREGVVVGKHIKSRASTQPLFRPARHRFAVGWHVQELEYTPLEVHEGGQSTQLQEGWTKEELIEELHSDAMWCRLNEATKHLQERHRSAIKNLESECSSGTKREFLESIITVLNNRDSSLKKMILEPLGITKDSEIYISWMQQRCVGLAEMADCSKKYAKDIDYGRHELNEHTKSKVGTRDEHQCVRCTTAENLVHHHIILASDGGDSDSENIALLCEKCHKKAHGNRWGETVYESVEEFWEWTDSDAAQD